MTWSPSNPDPGADTDPEWHAAGSQQRAPTPHLLLRRDWGGGKTPGREKKHWCQMGKENGDLVKIMIEKHFPFAENCFVSFSFLRLNEI